MATPQDLCQNPVVTSLVDGLTSIRRFGPALSGSRAHAQEWPHRPSLGDEFDQPAQSFTFTVSPLLTIFGLWGVTSTTEVGLQPGLVTLTTVPSLS